MTTNFPDPSDDKRMIYCEFDKENSQIVIKNTLDRPDFDGNMHAVIMERVYHWKFRDMDPEMGEFFARTLGRFMNESQRSGFEYGRYFIRRALGI